MRIVLATGIYPPDFGGPATYVRALAKQLSDAGDDVTVISYAPSSMSGGALPEDTWKVIRVPRGGGPLIRWMRYAMALRRVGANADVIEAFSSVSCGMPLILSGLRTPRRVLRLGGEFFWERYTDSGGRLPLQEWMRQNGLHHAIMGWLLRRFHHIVFSSRFQCELTLARHPALASTSVIENALPEPKPALHHLHTPLRLLFLGRFVRFKNLDHLLLALCRLPDATLTLAGDGPCRAALEQFASTLNLTGRVTFLPAIGERERAELFAEHDLLVLPSFTEISPNVALEARATGLPVLLTTSTGLSEQLTQGMFLRRLAEPAEIASAIGEARDRFAELATEAAKTHALRTWKQVADDHCTLFAKLTAPR